MIRGTGVIFQTILGSLLTWGLTAVGASLVFLFHSGNKKLLGKRSLLEFLFGLK